MYRRSALPAGPGVGGLAGGGGVPLAVQPDQRRLQKVPTDPLIVRPSGFRPLEHNCRQFIGRLPAAVEVQQVIALRPCQGFGPSTPPGTVCWK